MTEDEKLVRGRRGKVSTQAPIDSAKMFEIFGEHYSEQTRNDWEAGLEFRDGRKFPKPKSYYKAQMLQMLKDVQENSPEAKMYRKMMDIYESVKQ